MELDEGIRGEPLGLNDSEECSYENPEDGFEALKKALAEKYSENGGLGSILEKFSEILNPVQEESLQQQTQSQREFDVNSYFSENMLKDSLSDDDVITVSHRENGGYKAVFVKLGDLKKYLKS